MVRTVDGKKKPFGDDKKKISKNSLSNVSASSSTMSGVREKQIKPDFFYSKDEASDFNLYEKNRSDGNSVIEKVFNFSRMNRPDLKNTKLYDTPIYNNYSTIQDTFSASSDVIDKLIEWRNSDDNTKWKWLSPLTLEEGDRTNYNSMKYYNFDGHNTGFVTDAYKGKVSIILLSPDEFLSLADPSTEEWMKQDDKLTDKMKRGVPIDTPYIETRDGNIVYGHEGRHRAISAKEAGIKQIPVYVYNRDKITPDMRRKIVNSPMTTLRRRER
jgi:hypothetical protein